MFMYFLFGSYIYFMYFCQQKILEIKKSTNQH